MRKILFRGKRKDTEEWVEGFYVCAGGKLHYILIGKINIVYGNVEFIKFIVDPATIGQYTGLKDKNGQLIFEGDLVQPVLPPSISQRSFVWPIMPVVFSDGVFGLQDQRGGVTPFKSFAPRVTFEVKGNIHDNPELLKGGMNVKTPDEIKKGLLCCSHSDMSCSECPYDGICNTDSGETQEDDAVGLIDQLLSSYSQVSKALCGKENATLDELLQAVSQLKSRIAQVERERDAAVHDLPIGIDCNTCKYSERAYEEQPCSGCKEYRGPWYPVHWEWRGVCAENTKEA